MTIAEAALGPYVSREDAKRSLDWHVFGYWVATNNSRALKKVIGAVYDTINSMNNKKYWNQIFHKRSSEQMDCLVSLKRTTETGGLVTDMGISKHLVDYIRQKYQEEQKELTDKLLWNSFNNILRVLKRKRNNDPLYLLPKEDLSLTECFLRRLSNPPPREY